MMKRTFFVLLGLFFLSLQMNSSWARNLQAQPQNAEELQRSMQDHMARMLTAKPGKYQEMVEKAAGNITNCCSCHVEICDKGAGGIFQK